ncbi:MAG: calcium-binding protein [Solirubrobacterales bacterium]|nr:calcium-binding protein [Solirubrobacterales bacterium]
MNDRRCLPTILLAAAAISVCALVTAPAAGAKARISFEKRVLTAKGANKAERIVVSCSEDGLAKINGHNPSGGAVPCSKVVEVDVLAAGGNDTVDCSGIDGRFGQAQFEDFGSGTGCAVVADGGDDRVIGGRLALNLLYGGVGADRLSGGSRKDALVGNAGGDKLVGAAGKDLLLGLDGNDVLSGGPGADKLNGNDGDDVLRGADGSDFLRGGKGMDRIYGDKGRDRLIGGPGHDFLDGGPGRDLYAVNDDPPAHP